MNEPRSDDERLAALLDGRLGGAERDALLARLSHGGEDYTVFADTAAVLREAEAAEAASAPDGGEAGVIPLRRPRALPRPARWLAAAAAVAAVLLAANLLRSPGASDPVRLAARLEHTALGLPDGWSERAPWPSARGGSATAGQGARAGALLVDLAVAVEAEDTDAARLLAVQAAARFDPQGGREGPLARLAERAGEPAAALRPLVAEAAERLGERLGRDALEAGAWTEAARLAAHRRDDAFFRGRAGAAGLRRVERIAAADPSAAAAAAEVRALLEGAGPPAWAELGPALDRLLSALAAHPAPPPT